MTVYNPSPGGGSQTPLTSNIDGAGHSITNSPLAFNVQSANYTLQLSDASGGILHPSSDTTGRTWAIPANLIVAFPIGTMITLVNQNGAGTITFYVNTDTLTVSPTGATGSRSLAANGIAVIMKVDSTHWMVSGLGLT